MIANFTRMAVAVAAVIGLQLAHAATVNGVAIPDATIADSLRAAQLPDTPQAREAVKQQLIARELFRQEAAKDKALEHRPDVQALIADARNQILTQAWLKDHIKPAPVTDAEVRARYDGIVASLGDKEFKARVIELADDAAASVALSRIKAGEDFGNVAQQLSLAPSKAAGGAMDWISFKVPVQEGKTQNLPLAIAQAIASLPEGAVTPAPIALGDRRYVIKVDAVRPTQIPSFETAAPGIRQALQAQALERATLSLVTGLLSKAKITQ
ncbi:peptidyl-prolyl cis-trans isomerase [Cupriavidus plantarum]|uniref:peptidyl-prolyl cis-trans isomerase n=1 Tax=Cupriavidus plantarum TaxID=942865 RepID=UPI00339D5B37